MKLLCSLVRGTYMDSAVDKYKEDFVKEFFQKWVAVDIPGNGVGCIQFV